METEGMSIVNIHSEYLCGNDNRLDQVREHCTIHNRSDHAMRTLPQFFDPLLKSIYRVCGHRQFHIDPDELPHNIERFSCNNCCGCCR